MQTAFLAEFEARVAREWGHLSAKSTPTGVRLVGYVPQVGPAAWLHRFYPGSPSVELDQAERRMGRNIPLIWRSVLANLNGLSLFVGAVRLNGVLPGGTVRRSIEDPQPVSAEMSNTIERPRGALMQPDDFAIGSSSIGVGAVYVTDPGGSIKKLSRDGAVLLGRWDSLESMLTSEYEAMLLCHDKLGLYLDRV